MPRDNAMLRFDRSWKRRMVAVAAAVVLSAVAFEPTIALEQGKGNEPAVEEEKKGYTLPYFFTMIAVMAVVVPVCMACSRKWDFVADDGEDE